MGLEIRVRSKDANNRGLFFMCEPGLVLDDQSIAYQSDAVREPLLLLVVVAACLLNCLEDQPSCGASSAFRHYRNVMILVAVSWHTSCHQLEAVDEVTQFRTCPRLACRHDSALVDKFKCHSTHWVRIPHSRPPPGFTTIDDLAYRRASRRNYDCHTCVLFTSTGQSEVANPPMSGIVYERFSRNALFSAIIAEVCLACIVNFVFGMPGEECGPHGTTLSTPGARIRSERRIIRDYSNVRAHREGHFTIPVGSQSPTDIRCIFILPFGTPSNRKDQIEKTIIP